MKRREWRRPRGPLDTNTVISARAAILLVLGALAWGCDGGSSSPGPVIARVGDERVGRGELETYLVFNLLDDGGESPLDPAEAARVKSRLLDALVDEKILGAEALRRGLRVGNAEVDAYLAAGARPDDRQPAERDLGELIHQRLLAQKLLEEVARRLPPPTIADVAREIERARAEPEPRQRLRLRALRFVSLDTALGAAEGIRSGEISFFEAVATFETDPGQGVPIELSWERLPEELRRALADLQPGQVSRPVQVDGETYLFLVESWLANQEERSGEQARHAIETLRREQERRVKQDLLRKLRAAMPVEIYRRHLPFDYVPQPDG